MTIGDPLGRERVAPLMTDVWLRQLTRLRIDLRSARGEGEVARILRRAYYLACLAPDPLWFSVAPKIADSELEAVIESGDLAAAVRAMMPPYLEVSSGHPDGVATVTITAPKVGLSGHCENEDHPKALLYAWTDCFLSPGASGTGSHGEEKVVNLDRHRWRRAQRRSPSER